MHGNHPRNLNAVQRHALGDSGGITHELEPADAQVTQYLSAQTEGSALPSRDFCSTDGGGF